MGLYICDISDFMNLDGLELVTPGRKKRVLAYRQPPDRARSLAAGLFLRKFCGVRDDAQLAYGENEKPYLKNQGLYFNISHSGSYVALATSEAEVGVDIEKIAPRREDIIGRCFQPEEEEYMREEGGDSFFYFWTAKESVMKLLGRGMSLPPQSFSVLPLSAAPRRICGKTMFFDWRAYNGHIICRAGLQRAAVDDDLRIVTTAELLSSP